MTLVRQHPDAEGVDFEYKGADTTLPVSGDPDLLHRATPRVLAGTTQLCEALDRFR